MTTAEFNPFTDRLSRDIRNDLSESLPEVINQRSLSPAKIVADGYLAKQLQPAHCHYITNRLEKYEIVLKELPLDNNDYMNAAVLLWDLELFFEVHEILEPEWIMASGDHKLLLQALIRAAGVYINLELKYRDRASKISTKALPVLIGFQQKLERVMNVKHLISALEKLSPTAPHIGLKKIQPLE